MRKRKWSDEQLHEAVKKSKSYSAVLKKLNLKLAGGSHAQVKMRIEQLGLNTSHFTGKGWCTGQHHKKLTERIKIPTDKILVEDSTYTSTHHLKVRLFKEGILKESCEKCGLGSVWNGSFLSLQIDHKNGKRTDNRIQNLRILCPNCHSQTESFAGKAKKYVRD